MWIPLNYRRHARAANGAISAATFVDHHRFIGFARDGHAAVALGQRHHAMRQRDPAADLRRRRTLPCALRAIEANEFGGATDEEHDAVCLRIEQRRATGGGERRFGLAVDDLQRQTDFWRRRARNSLAVLGARQASVAIRRARVTPRFFILLRQIARAAMARSIAASLKRPELVTPSPSRMMREKASTTRKPSPAGRATSKRQLLVPRSSAAQSGRRGSLPKPGHRTDPGDRRPQSLLEAAAGGARINRVEAGGVPGPRPPLNVQTFLPPPRTSQGRRRVRQCF